MLWISVALLLVALGLSELLRQLRHPASGALGLVLSLAFAVGAVGLVVALVGALDIEDAGQALDWASARLASQHGLVTAVLAGAGLALGFGGAARLVDRVALADPDGPLPDTTSPGLACGVGVLLLMATYWRI